MKKILLLTLIAWTSFAGKMSNLVPYQILPYDSYYSTFYFHWTVGHSYFEYYVAPSGEQLRAHEYRNVGTAEFNDTINGTYSIYMIDITWLNKKQIERLP